MEIVKGGDLSSSINEDASSKASNLKKSRYPNRTKSDRDLKSLASTIRTSAQPNDLVPLSPGRVSPESDLEHKNFEEKKNDFHLSSEALTVELAQELLDNRIKRLAEIESETQTLLTSSLEPSLRIKAMNALLHEKNSMTDESINHRLNLTKNALKAQQASFKFKPKLSNEEIADLTLIEGKIKLIRDFQWENNLSPKAKITTIAKETGIMVVEGAVTVTGDAIVSVASNVVPVGKSFLAGVGSAAVFAADRLMDWFKE